MDDTKDDERYPPNNMYGVSHRQGYGYLNHQKHVTNECVEDNNDEDEEDVEQLGEDDDVNQSNSIHSEKDVGDEDDDDSRESRDEVENGDNNNNGVGKDDGDDDNDVDDDTKNKSYTKRVEDDLEWHPKKRKLKSLISAYEFAPRVAVPSSAAAACSVPKPSLSGRKSLTDWTEHETFALLDAWGDRFLQHGRKSLRSEQWQEVAEKVSEVSKTERTETQCRNRLDTLKKKYKKEKTKLPVGSDDGGSTSKWVYFKRMDKLMSSPPQQAGLSCGLDSGEYVFMNPRVYLNRANVLDEMRDSPGNSESIGEEEDLEGLHPKKRRNGGDNDETSSFRLLADSIQKFGEIYEKIENSKRRQMVELEKMRMDFHRELETQKRQILERVQSEIAKLQQRNEEENDDSVENSL